MKTEPGTAGLLADKTESTVSAGQVVAFGLLLATSTGIGHIPPHTYIVGHSARTAGYDAGRFVIEGPSTAARNSAEELRALRSTVSFTWDQLARLFGVSRRAVHHWASGDSMNSRNLEWLLRLKAEFEALPGTPDQRRNLLLTPDATGYSRFEMLRREFRAGAVEVNANPLAVSGYLGEASD